MAGFWQKILFLEWIYWITHGISRWALMGTEPNWEKNRLILSSFQGICLIGGNTTRVHCTAFPGSLFSLWHTYSWINVSWVGNRYKTTDCPFPSQFKHFYPEPCVAGGKGEDTSGGLSLQDMQSWNVIHFNGNYCGKESACNAGDLGSIPGLGRSPGEWKGYPLQYPGLENSMDCIVHGIAKSRKRLSYFHFHFQSRMRSQGSGHFSIFQSTTHSPPYMLVINRDFCFTLNPLNLEEVIQWFSGRTPRTHNSSYTHIDSKWYR